MPVPPNNSIRSITSLSVLYSRSKLDAPRGDLSTTTYKGKKDLKQKRQNTCNSLRFKEDEIFRGDNGIIRRDSGP